MKQKRIAIIFFYAIRVTFLQIVLALIFTFTSYANRIHAQVVLNKPVTVMAEQKVVKEILVQVENQTGVKFTYSSSNVIDINRKISCTLANKKLVEFLDEVLKPLDIDYRVIDDEQILLYSIQNSVGNIKAFSAAANPINVTIFGIVTNEKGEPLQGASITEKGTKNITVTDAGGTFNLKVKDKKTVIIISYTGYKTKEVVVDKEEKITIVLSAINNVLDDVVVVGYGTQKKKSLTGSVATVNGEEISVAPLASTANTLAGRLPGLISLQSSGQPGADAAALSIRGFGGPLVIVDGVEADFNNIDPNAIESISILKDGAASIYGARAGNGVILVTTKRGKNEKPTITLNSAYTLQGITEMPKPASSGQNAEMATEAYLNNGGSPSTVPYTPEQIQKYYNGTDPLYLNTDWYNVLIRKWAPQQQHNLSIRGGSERIKYYGFVGYVNQGSIWKINGGDYSRYNLQSNIDAKITDELSLQLDIATTVESRKSTRRGQQAGANTVWQDFWNTDSRYPATLPDPTKISFANGGGTGGAHVVTNRDIWGYNDGDNQNIRGTISLNYNVSAVKGLSAKAFINVIQDYGTNKSFVRPVKFYTYDPGSMIYTLAGALGSKASLSYYKNQGRRIIGQFSVNYDRIFSEDHHITALGLYEAIDYSSDYLSAGRVNFLTPSIDQLFAGSTNGMSNNGAATEMGRKSYVGRLNYSFKNKYLVETIIRADASAKFPSNKRWGYFPGISAGWRINEEKFMRKFKNIDNLKIRISCGESGNDGVGNFQYLSGYQYGNTYPFGGTAQQGLLSTGLANPDLTWEKIKIYNFGTDFSFWDRKLYGELDAFYRMRSGIPVSQITTLPSTFGASLPPENINSLTDRGFELRIGTAGAFKKDFFWDISGNISWSRSKWDHYEEPVYQDLVQSSIYKQSGRWTDRAYGYLSEGLFTSQDEIKKLAFNQDGQNNITLRPGDIKYKDINGDGKLDWRDQEEIGKGTTPHWMLGINTNLKYRNFDLSALFQGAFGYYNYIIIHGSAAVLYNERWTQANNNLNALVPRLGGAATNNGLRSDYYYKKAGYLRLKVLTLGYNMPKNVLDKIGFNQLRIYMAATNLLTFDKLKKYGTDPEAPSGMSGYYYPQQKTITFGINLSL